MLDNGPVRIPEEEICLREFVRRAGAVSIKVCAHEVSFEQALRKCEIRDPVLFRAGTWCVTEKGVHCLVVPATITNDNLRDQDEIEWMCRKSWVVAKDLLSAIRMARHNLDVGRASILVQPTAKKRVKVTRLRKAKRKRKHTTRKQRRKHA